MEKRTLPRQWLDAVSLRGLSSSSTHDSILPPVATRERPSITLERIFDQINSSSSDVRSVLDLLDSVRSKTNSLVVERKGEDARRGEIPRYAGDDAQETSVADVPRQELGDLDQLFRHQRGTNDHTSLCQKNTDLLSVRKFAHTTPGLYRNGEGCSVKIGGVRSSSLLLMDVDAPKPSTLSKCTESPMDKTQRQLPAASISQQPSICSRPSLTSFSHTRKPFSHMPTKTLTQQVNELPRKAGAVKWSRPNNFVNQLEATQLTIFYAGKVNVYDNVQPEMAKAIMILASSCNSSSQCFIHNEPSVIKCSSGDDDAEADDDDVPVIPTSMCGTSNTSSGMALRYNSLTEFNSTSKSSIAPVLISRPTEPMSAAVHPSTSVSTAITQMNPRRLHPDLPVARKASLVRFLQKRKDRIQEKAAVNETENAICVEEDATGLSSERPKSHKKQCIRRHHVHSRMDESPQTKLMEAPRTLPQQPPVKFAATQK
eukprot:c22903_g1_i1 orf=316-1770(-)